MNDTLSPREFPKITANTTAAEYVFRATKQHEERVPKSWFSKTLFPTFRWIGDAFLAVAPINRISTAVGLSLGLTGFALAGNVISGHKRDGTPVAKSENKILGSFHNIIGYDPVRNTQADRNKNYAMYGLYSLGGAIGMAVGTNLAYRSAYKKNRHPEYLEDYDARVSQEQADGWTPLAAFSSIFGSSSGFAMIPIPGINYAISLASRTVLMQNRNNMTPGFHKWLSGTFTSSTLGVREGLQDLIKYAVNNPAETPTQLEFKSFHILSQLFPEVKAEPVQQFVNKIHHFRDAYYEPGGVPKDQKKALETALTAEFTKAGFENTLIEIGLNPRASVLTKLNGFMGQVGAAMGKRSKINALAKEYDAKVTARHSDLPASGVMLPASQKSEPVAVVEPQVQAAHDDATPPPQEAQGKVWKDTTKETSKPKEPAKNHVDRRQGEESAVVGKSSAG